MIPDIPITTSAEARWFYDASRASTMKTWFDLAVGHPTVPEIREDLYHRDLTPQSGIKLRRYDGGLHFEFKFRRTQTFKQDKCWSGYIETWEKWTMKLVSPQTLDHVKTDFWFPVKKTRHLVKLDTSGATAIINESSFLREGCGFEFTLLTLNDTVCCTIGFEAFSQVGREESNLLRGMDFIFANTQSHIYLGREDSRSYPQWIASKFVR